MANRDSRKNNSWLKNKKQDEETRKRRWKFNLLGLAIILAIFIFELTR